MASAILLVSEVGCVERTVIIQASSTAAYMFGIVPGFVPRFAPVTVESESVGMRENGGNSPSEYEKRGVKTQINNERGSSSSVLDGLWGGVVC